MLELAGRHIEVMAGEEADSCPPRGSAGLLNQAFIKKNLLNGFAPTLIINMESVLAKRKNDNEAFAITPP